MTETKIKNLRELLEQAKTYQELADKKVELQKKYYVTRTIEDRNVVIDFGKSKWVSVGLVEQQLSQLGEMDMIQWLIEHEAEIQKCFARPLLQVSRAEILGFFVDKEILGK